MVYEQIVSRITYFQMCVTTTYVIMEDRVSMLVVIHHADAKMDLLDLTVKLVCSINQMSTYTQINASSCNIMKNLSIKYDDCIHILFSAPKPECTSNYECPKRFSCIQEKCQDPCKTDVTCGTNAQCVVQHHRALCICKDGFVGDPHSACTECRTSIIFV